MFAPSVKEERTTFLQNLPDLSTYLLPNTHLIMNGDFNMVLSNTSIISGLKHSDKEIKCFNTFINTYKLVDSWKKKNPDKESYSWIRFINQKDNQQIKTEYVARRLDYMFCSTNLDLLSTHSEMQHYSSTDHKAVITHFKLDDYPRGQGYFMFNDSLLEDGEFIQTMSILIKEQYESLKLENEYSNNIIWDLIKIAIRDESMAFSTQKNIAKRMEYGINERMNILNDQLLEEPLNMSIINELCKLTKEKEINDLAISRGALKRSRAKLIVENERNSSFFLGLEQARQTKRIIKSIYDDNGILIESPDKILPIISDFYKTLMNTNDEAPIDSNQNGKTHILDTFLNDATHPVLNEEDKSMLEEPISILELEEALKHLNTDSAPGYDGLTPLFYASFWDVIKQPLFDSLTESIDNKKLTVSQRRAVITLLPKSSDSEALRDISMWRPISLTSTDYKLFSKVLATRLQRIIHKLVNDNQVGYIKGRNINDHIRFIDDMINYAKVERLPGILVSLDYRKAFDTVSKQAILASLDKLNFGPVFAQYVTTILNDTEATIKNAGWCSDWFKTTRGVRQGCNLSPLLFILVVEFLAIKIRSNQNIEGILENTKDIFENETKLSQYADDMSLYVKSIHSLTYTLKEIDEFSKFSGLMLNRKKSIAMWLGINKSNNPGGKGLTWLSEKDNIKILGIYFNANKEASLIEQNWNIKIEEIRNVICNWTKRNCSIWGKSIVAKTFLLSKLNYVLQSLHLPYNIQKEIDNMIFKFLWKTNTNKSGVEKIKRSTLCLDTDEGGISMILVETQQKVMLLKWLHRLILKKNSTRHKLIDTIFKPVGGLEYFLSCNTNSATFKGLDKIKSTYWQKAMTAWLELDKSTLDKNNQQPIPLFNNNQILYKNKPLLIKKWLDKDLKYMHQMCVNGRIKTYMEIKTEIGTYGALILDYLAIRNAIVNSKTPHDLTEIPELNPYKSTFVHLSNRTIRNMISKRIERLNCIAVWLRKINVDVSKHYSTAVHATKESKLRLLHYKIIHNIYPCNALLYKMKIKQSSKCDDCPELEFLDHMFVECITLKPFWKHIEHKLAIIVGRTITISTAQAQLKHSLG